MATEIYYLLKLAQLTMNYLDGLEIPSEYDIVVERYLLFFKEVKLIIYVDDNRRLVTVYNSLEDLESDYGYHIRVLNTIIGDNS